MLKQQTEVSQVAGHNYLVAFCIFLASSFLYLALRSNVYTAVDGAMRCMEVFQKQTLFFHQNNHLLYPVWMLLWSKLLAAIGISASDGIGFMRISQSLNSFAGGASLGLLYLILTRVAKSKVLVLVAVSMLGLSAAFMLHATNAAEVMPGFVFCLLAFVIEIEAIERNSKILFVGAGAVFALSLASYQAMGTAVPLAAILCFLPPGEPRTVPPWPKAMERLAWIAAGGTAGLILIYSFAYSTEGVPIAKMPAKFLTFEGGSEVYGGFGLTRVLNIPGGYLKNLLSTLPADYSGLSTWLTHPDRLYWIPFNIALLVLSGYLFLAPLPAWLRSLRSQLNNRVVLGAIVLAVLAIILPLCYWAPLYDKLWLLPLTLLTVYLGLIIGNSQSNTNQRRAPFYILVLFVVIEAVNNLPAAIRDSRRETPFLKEAQEVAAIVGANCAVIDFDEISMIYLGFRSVLSPVLTVPASLPGEARDWLVRAPQSCPAKLYFIGILDLSPVAWEPFLHQRVGINYDLLDPYRRGARVVRSFPYRQASITLREYDLSPP